MGTISSVPRLAGSSACRKAVESRWCITCGQPDAVACAPRKPSLRRRTQALDCVAMDALGMHTCGGVPRRRVDARSGPWRETAPSASRVRAAAAPSRSRRPDRSCARARCARGPRCAGSDSVARSPQSAPAPRTAPARSARPPGLQLDADRVVVAVVAPPVAGAPACQARSSQTTNCISAPSRRMKKCAETCMPRICWKYGCASQSSVLVNRRSHLVAAVLAGRQADRVHHHQVDVRARGARPELGEAMRRARYQPCCPGSAGSAPAPGHRLLAAGRDDPSRAMR